MKRILSYKLFEEQETPELTPEQIRWLNTCAGERWELNPETGLVDIDGNFRCDEQNLTDFKGVKFGTIRRNFYCHNNQLASLDGAPVEVGGNFICSRNQLASLEGAPKSVGGDFHCHNNQLASLDGAPKSVGGDFYCRYNQLTSLDGAPEKIGGTLYCSDNPVGYETLLAIYDLMKSGRSYTEALSQYWDQMTEEDKILMYGDNPDLSADEKRGYELRDKASSRIY
jgi:hypothetical protein